MYLLLFLSLVPLVVVSVQRAEYGQCREARTVERVDIQGGGGNGQREGDDESISHECLLLVPMMKNDARRRRKDEAPVGFGIVFQMDSEARNFTSRPWIRNSSSTAFGGSDSVMCCAIDTNY
jgi:hypothetical protein